MHCFTLHIATVTSRLRAKKRRSQTCQLLANSSSIFFLDRTDNNGEAHRLNDVPCLKYSQTHGRSVMQAYSI